MLGTPPLSLGSYDELLGRFAERRGDLGEAGRRWRAACEQGRLVGSPHQVALADTHLARVAPTLPGGGNRPAATGPQRVVAIPPSTGMTEPVTYEPARLDR